MAAVALQQLDRHFTEEEDKGQNGPQSGGLGGGAGTTMTTLKPPDSGRESTAAREEIRRKRTSTASRARTLRKRPKMIRLERDTKKPRDVFSWFEITLNEVNVPMQSFTCSVEIHLFWQDFTMITDEFDPDTMAFRLDPKCVPIKMTEIWENKLSSGVSNISYKYLTDTATIYMQMTCNVQFTERMELGRFPLDRQFLNMLFNAKVKEGNWNWLLDYNNYPDWVPKEFCKPFEVRMNSTVTEYNMLAPWVDFSTDQPLTIRFRVERLPGYYFGNVILPNFLIVLSCFSCFAVSRHDVADRLSVSINLMLSAVAFRYVIAEMLPAVNYMTWMDWYILVGFVGLTFFIAENAIVGIPAIPDGIAKYCDYTLAGLFFVVWMVMHAFVALLIFHSEMGRVPWSTMDLLDAEEDPEDQFEVAQEAHTKGRQATKFGKDEWNRYKDKRPETWARMFSREHPELGINLKDDENEEDSFEADKDMVENEKVAEHNTALNALAQSSD